MLNLIIHTLLLFLLFCKHAQNIKFPHTNKHIISPKTTTSTKRRNFFLNSKNCLALTTKTTFYQRKYEK